MKSHQEGFIALLAVLIISAICGVITISLLISGSDRSRSALVRQQSAQAAKLADSCGEEALQQLHDNTAFVSSGSLSFGQGNCTYSVTDTGGDSRKITVSGTVADVVRKAEIYAMIDASSISVISWQDTQ